MQGAVPKCGPARAGSYKDSRKDLHCSATTNAWFEFLDATRMGNDPRNSVVNAWHQAHDVKNLFVVDGSSFTTSAAVNPTSTIGALALRCGDGIWERRRECQ